MADLMFKSKWDNELNSATKENIAEESLNLKPGRTA